jgi:hypothetical protein
LSQEDSDHEENSRVHTREEIKKKRSHVKVAANEEICNDDVSKEDNTLKKKRAGHKHQNRDVHLAEVANGHVDDDSDLVKDAESHVDDDSDSVKDTNTLVDDESKSVEHHDSHVDDDSDSVKDAESHVDDESKSVKHHDSHVDDDPDSVEDPDKKYKHKGDGVHSVEKVPGSLDSDGEDDDDEDEDGDRESEENSRVGSSFSSDSSAVDARPKGSRKKAKKAK